MSQNSQIEERALQMLGSGAPANIVAAALGVSESRISQMLAEEDFASKVQDLRYNNLQRQTELDDKYTGLEEKLLDKLEKVLPLMAKPRDVLAAVQVINNAKRRGAQTAPVATTGAQVVQLVLPQFISQKFISNVNNQVVEVRDEQGGARSLVTASSGSLGELAAQHLDKGTGEEHDSDTITSQELARLQSPEVAPARLSQSSPAKRDPKGPISVEDLL